MAIGNQRVHGDAPVLVLVRAASMGQPGKRSRELGEYPIVYLDAHYEKVRGRVQDVAILKAIGVNRFGTRCWVSQ